MIDGWNAAWPLPQSPRPLLERIVDDAGLLTKYRKHSRALLETQFQPAKLGARLDRLYALIEDDLRDDPFPRRRITNRTDRSYADVIASMKQFMAKRYETAREQLENPGPRPARVARRPARGDRGDGPQPGKSSLDAPSELVVVSNSHDGVKLRWKDNATGERAFIVQRRDGAKGGRFRNVVGLPGENLTSATDRNVQPGRTYRYRVFAIKPTPHGPAGTGVSNIVTVRVRR